MSKFGLVFLAVMGLAAALAWLRPAAASSGQDTSPCVAANERVTALTGALLFALLAAIAVTVLFIRPLIAVHYLVGLALIPPVGLKLAATGYRFFRYYAGDADYRHAGAPPVLLRFGVAPLLVISTVAVFASGVELWLFGLRFGSWWVSAHTVSAVAFIAALGPHLYAHTTRSAAVALETVTGDLAGGFRGRTAVATSLVLGLVFAAASLVYASPFPGTAG